MDKYNILLNNLEQELEKLRKELKNKEESLELKANQKEKALKSIKFAEERLKSFQNSQESFKKYYLKIAEFIMDFITMVGFEMIALLPFLFKSLSGSFTTNILWFLLMNGIEILPISFVRNDWKEIKRKKDDRKRYKSKETLEKLISNQKKELKRKKEKEHKIAIEENALEKDIYFLKDSIAIKEQEIAQIKTSFINAYVKVSKNIEETATLENALDSEFEKDKEYNFAKPMLRSRRKK